MFEFNRFSHLGERTSMKRSPATPSRRRQQHHYYPGKMKALPPARKRFASVERSLALVLRLVRRYLGEVGSLSEGGCEA